MPGRWRVECATDADVSLVVFRTLEAVMYLASSLPRPEPETEVDRAKTSIMAAITETICNMFFWVSYGYMG